MNQLSKGNRTNNDRSFAVFFSPHNNIKQFSSMYRHDDSAIDALLLRLHDMKNCVEVISQNESGEGSDLNQMRFFISGIENLTETLSLMRLGIEHALKWDEVINY